MAFMARNISRRSFILGGLGALAGAACSEGLERLTCPPIRISRRAVSSLEEYVNLYQSELKQYSNSELEGSRYSNDLENTLNDMAFDAHRLTPKYTNSPVLASASEPIRGDFNANGKADIFDLLELLKVLSGRIPFDTKYDLDNNSKVNIFDLLEHLKILSSQAQNYITINGKLLDTDTWQPNSNLRGWVEAAGNKVYANDRGEYSIRIEKQDKVDIMAGYLDGNDAPASFVTTARDVDGNVNQNGLDVAVLNYSDLTYTSPEELKAVIVYANAADYYNYNGIWEVLPLKYTEKEDAYLRCLNQEQYFYLSKHNKLNGRDYSDEEFTRLQQDVDAIQSVLVRKLPVVLDTTAEGFFPVNEQEAQKKILISKGSPIIGSKDYGGDGRMDFIGIELYSGNHPDDPGATREEVMSGLGGFNGIARDVGRNDGLTLETKSIFYESSAIDLITEADIKLVRLVNAITYNVGQLKPGIQVKDVLKFQQ